MPTIILCLSVSSCEGSALIYLLDKPYILLCGVSMRKLPMFKYMRMDYVNETSNRENLVVEMLYHGRKSDDVEVNALGKLLLDVFVLIYAF